MKVRSVAVAVMSLVLLVSVSAGAEQYLLATGKWKASHTKAVERAGGEIIFAHGPTGIALVESVSPSFLEEMIASGSFSFAEADLVVEWDPPLVADQAVSPADDTHYQKQWNLDAIDAPEAWSAGCTGHGARVAVLDGGINDTHGDLDGQVDVACSASFVAPYPFNYDVGGFWHGSHVAGIVAAKDNDFGIVGVAPDATIMGVKVLHDGSGSFGAIIGGILFASDPAAFGPGCTEKADIINMSLSGWWFKSEAKGYHSLVNKAVNFAASKGVLVLSAAANYGVDTQDYPNLVFMPAMAGSGLAISATGPIGWQAVGNTDFTRFASYSNYGHDLVDLAGPGGDFAYPGNESCTFDGTEFECWVFDMVPAPCGGYGGGGTCWAAGTSMATPAAAGVAALIKGANPNISLGALKAKLKNSAIDVGKKGTDKYYGHGFINAYNACIE